MCGRFVITSPPDALRQIFGYLEQPNFPPGGLTLRQLNLCLWSSWKMAGGIFA